MSLCPSPIRKSSARTSCGSRGAAARVSPWSRWPPTSASLHDVGKGTRRADVDDGAKPGVARRARCGKRVGRSSCWSRRTRSCAGLPAYFRRRICGEKDLPAREELAVTSRARWLDGEQRTRTRSRARVAWSSPRRALTKGDEARFTWGSAERCRVPAYSWVPAIRPSWVLPPSPRARRLRLRVSR